ILVEGHDFFSSPRLSPDGSRLAWLAWDHPNMPWNGTTLYVATVGEDGAFTGAAEAIAGGPTESIFQPEWSPDGAIIFVSDRSRRSPHRRLSQQRRGNRIPDHRRQHSSWSLLSAAQPRLCRRAGRESTAAPQVSRRPDRGGIEHAEPRHPVLDKPRHRGAGGKPWRQHRLWPRLSRAPS